MTEPFGTLIKAERGLSLGAQVDEVLTRKNGTLPGEDAVFMGLTSADLLVASLADEGSSKTAMVGEEGIEPSRA
jgi:hypothetical protein